MRKLIGLALLILLAGFGSPAHGQGFVQFSVCGVPARTLTPGGVAMIGVDLNGNLCATGTFTAVDSAMATAAAPAYVEGTQNPFSQNLTGDLRTIAKQSGTWNIATLTALTAITNALPAGTNLLGKVGIDQTTPGTTNLVAAGQNGAWTVQPGNTANTTAWLMGLNATPSIANGNGVIVAPSSAAASGIAPTVSGAAESNHVLKAGAGNLYGLTVTIGATSGYLMLFDATSLPVNGTVTPKYCFPITSNGTNGGASFSWLPGPPLNFVTGITAGFSTTGCFTLTASATGNFFGQVQ